MKNLDFRCTVYKLALQIYFARKCSVLRSLFRAAFGPFRRAYIYISPRSARQRKKCHIYTHTSRDRMDYRRCGAMTAVYQMRTTYVPAVVRCHVYRHTHSKSTQLWSKLRAATPPSPPRRLRVACPSPPARGVPVAACDTRPVYNTTLLSILVPAQRRNFSRVFAIRSPFRGCVR